MPQHQSAAKRVRQNAKRREQNRQKRSRMRTLLKKVHAANTKEEALPLLNETKAYLDRMATKGLIHKNKAANYKSALEQHVNQLS